MTLLIAALVLFVAFHFLPGFGCDRGWQNWPGLWNGLMNLRDFIPSPEVGIVLATFLNFSLMITASPFLTKVWLKSRIAWCFATVCSGLAALGFVGAFVLFPGDSEFGPGGWCLLLAPLLNFFGLLLARGKTPPEHVIPAS